MPVVGILDPGTTYIFDAFEEGMRRLGYIEGRTIVYVKRSAGGKVDLIPQMAAEIVSKKVDVIVSGGPLPIRTLLKETSTKPIVFVALGDPIGVGAVRTLAKPGGNATGLSIMNSELNEKRQSASISSAPLHDPPPRSRSTVL
jgi:putative ABC transport system substrate-binding protein